MTNDWATNTSQGLRVSDSFLSTKLKEDQPDMSAARPLLILDKRLLYDF